MPETSRIVRNLKFLDLSFSNQSTQIGNELIHLFRGRASVVRLGSIDLAVNDEHTHVIAILKIHPHPDYKTTSKYNDIALMQLSEKVYFTEYVRPACLNIDNYLEWTDAIAIGFGRESFGILICIIIFLIIIFRIHA